MSSSEADTMLARHGWAAVPRSHSKALSRIKKNEHAELDLASVKMPDTDVSKKVYEYARSTLPEKTFNHSMRVWNYGTTPEHMEGTHLSFEYWGAIKARTFLNEHGAPNDQADAVCEAIVRHAELDNAGANPHLIATETIEQVVAKYPRKGWSSCFATCMTKEMDLKPWCRTTAQEGFVESIAGNELMAPFD
ncbi:hypothetical protein OPT61_g1023 [Boeremia exigua]|uniref:Uncharacterized protein n=1 Tax=Boeremia exigua TaxID=749465 RepID=A0ACC2IS54_9PLEO|nr:hypothetical protein OPT61_g1023 [Boeremia exigua]